MANGSRLTGVADGLVPRKSAGMPDVITCTSEGDDLSGRRRRGVNRPDDAPAGQRTGASPVPGLAMTRPLVVTGIPCASRMIPLESPVLEIGTPGSESGGRKRVHGSRPAARVAKAPDKSPVPYRQRASSRLYYKVANCTQQQPVFCRLDAVCTWQSNFRQCPWWWSGKTDSAPKRLAGSALRPILPLHDLASSNSASLRSAAQELLAVPPLSTGPASGTPPSCS